MAGVTGLDLLASVRERGWQNPVVLVSAFADDETRARARALGATALLEKPIDLGRLRRIIEASVVQ
jgi:CheY-like chemotaxis protein